MKQFEAIAKTPEEAIEKALEGLNATIDQVELEIFEASSKGLLSFLKAKEVRVVATLKESPADKGIAFLNSILKEMNIDATLKHEKTERELKINIEGENMGVVIGRRGQTLDSLQYLVSLVVNKNTENYMRVILDTENYRQKREKSLINLANKLAYRAKKFRKSITLEPMNPYERRIIHSSLQGNKYVSTRSEGEEPYRKVIIYLNKNN